MQKSTRYTRTLQQRFDERWILDEATGCHLWIGSANNCGYGTMRFLGRMLHTHRVAWELTRGPIPAGMHVCHICDVPRCVNATHLFRGTPADNAADRDRKGRGAARRRARLTDADVAEIRALAPSGAVVRDVARRFNVTPGYIRTLALGKRRAHPYPTTP